MKKLRWLACLAVLPLLAFQIGGSKWYALSPGKELTLPKPDEYRQWTFVGSSTVPADINNGKAIFPGLHHVYIDPDSYQHRQEKGVFPDGTILLMEVLHMARRESESGFGYFSTGGRDLLVQIKDRRVFPGDGWGYFMASDAELKAGKQVVGPADSRCQACHQAAAGDDEVFTQYYPALKP